MSSRLVTSRWSEDSDAELSPVVRLDEGAAMPPDAGRVHTVERVDAWRHTQPHRCEATGMTQVDADKQVHSLIEEYVVDMADDVMH